MSAQDSHPVAEVVSKLNDWLNAQFSQLEQLAQTLLEVVQLEGSERVSISGTARKHLRDATAAFLSENTVADGCGLIFASMVTENKQSGHLEWWVREDEQRFSRYSFGLIPGADRFYDYEHHEWFTRAYHDGAVSLVGPYIDYLGIEAYVVTLTVPAEIQGTRVGAIGCDIQVPDLERELLPILLKNDTALAVVGAHGHVLCSNSPKYLPGEYVAGDEGSVRWIPLEPAATSLRLLVGQ